MNNKIALIGGSGFLGTKLSKTLNRTNINYTIFDIVSPFEDKNFLYADVRSEKSLEQLNGATHIINLAAEHKDNVDPISKYDEVNIQGAVNVCKAASNFNINKIIFTSSVAIYGFAPADTDESGEANYFNDYGRTKFLAEHVYKNWQAEDPINRSLVIIRPTVIFGEGNRGNVYNLLNQIASKRFIMFGDGKNRKSMAYVDNVAAFIEFNLSSIPGVHIYNYVDKPDLDMNTLVSAVRQKLFMKNNVGFRFPKFLGIFIGYLADMITLLIKKNLPVSSIRVKKFMGTTQFASSVSSTGFIPPVSLEDGLAKTLNYEFIEDNSNNKTFDTE